MLFSTSCQMKGETKHAVHSGSSKERLLNYGFLVGPFIDAATNIGVLSLVIFTDDHEIDVGWLPVLEGGLDTFQQTHWPQVDVLLKAALDRYQQTPK